MKHAYYTHHNALSDFKAARTPLEKRNIAMTYFTRDAEIVDAEIMKKKLEEESR